MIAKLLPKSVFVLAAFTILSGCHDLPGHPKPGPEIARPDDILDAQTLYRENCVSCHGAHGVDGPSYPLANPEYQAIVDEPGLRQVVTEGVAGAMMPAFGASAGGPLTDKQVGSLVAGLRAEWYKPGVLAGEKPPPYRATLNGDPARGGQVYAAYCARCHGTAGQAAAGKAGSITDPTFLALISDQGLRTIIIAGRPDLGQPDWKSLQPGHPLSDQEVTDVVAWLSSQRPNQEEMK